MPCQHHSSGRCQTYRAQTDHLCPAMHFIQYILHTVYIAHRTMQFRFEWSRMASETVLCSPDPLLLIGLFLFTAGVLSHLHVEFFFSGVFVSPATWEKSQIVMDMLHISPSRKWNPWKRNKNCSSGLTNAPGLFRQLLIAPSTFFLTQTNARACWFTMRILLYMNGSQSMCIQRAHSNEEFSPYPPLRTIRTRQCFSSSSSLCGLFCTAG